MNLSKCMEKKMIFKDCDLENLELKQEGNVFTLKEPNKIEVLQILNEVNTESFKLKINDEQVHEFQKTNQTPFLINLKSQCTITHFEFISDAKLQVTAFKRKNPALLVCGRADALGSRMSAFLTALYLSKKFHFKFAFVWDTLDKDKGVAFIESAAELFEKEFLKEHDYSNVLPLRGDGNTLCFSSLKELQENPYKSAFWGTWVMNYYILNTQHLSDLDEKEYLDSLWANWNNLPFKTKYKNQISNAITQAKSIGPFVALHMRGGDSIETTHYRRLLFSPIIYKYIFPVDLAIFSAKHFIKEGFKVVLFGADTEANMAIKMYLKDEVCCGSFFLASDFHSNLNDMQAQIFEITLLSRARKIIANHSTYSKFAAALGQTELINFTTYFDSKTLYNAFILTKSKDFLKISNIQKAASLAFMYLLSLKNEKSFEKRIQILQLALEFDVNNSCFRIMFINELFKAGFLQRAENYLKITLCERLEEFLSSLLAVLWGKHRVHQECFDFYKKYADSKYPYISFVAAKIYEFEKNPELALASLELCLKKEKNNEIFLKNLAKISPSKILLGAPLRVQNTLSYRLGRLCIQAKKNNLKDFCKLCIKLMNEAVIFSEEKKYKQAPLKEYADYKESLKVQQHLSYQLGSALIKAYKYRYIGGFVKFLLYDLPKIQKEFKEKQKRKSNETE
ncbi:hypothetical protein OQH60_05675 [Campylobacter sp. MIT 21-1685]|uniref:hypothetical protein n=1 Tax=unclassified Campylobacter TaxID=2593542 RepID=UPI00224B78FE|nr:MULTISPECIES: hypothetical protein [unclassified Campylobacter]MCX2683309.1 hypothetical protein [Campylobacter sp. MIT 21-1684]MCX2751635.1 hypothetical protein [Campylobacter sp. MIT 21-1682]MCX2807835.1 hypothetical protein [Campylobacter sp. MIT 21-1685]